ncbi:cobalamin-binding protein [Halomonas sp. 18H]|nr:cobalamin-binding protein [Halomonas sp. 18H]MCW4151555.1 cobalamin-binding protein [Halomonas sp. 18H]
MTRLLNVLGVVALALGVAGAASGEAGAAMCVTDDAGREVCVERPAERIIALSPGVTELLYAAGAGERLVGAVSFSDHPAAAAELPRVGSSDRLDLEAMLALSPDLVVAWSGGNPEEQVERLIRLGIPVFYSAADDFATIASNLERLGALANTQATAHQTASQLRAEVAALRRRHADAEPVSVFYQVWQSPLMTLNGEHWISQALALCGGVNLFAEQSALVPRIGVEAVLGRDPEAIITGGRGKADAAWLDAWREFPDMTAVRQDNLFFINPDLVQRTTPRLVEGTRDICRHLEAVRERR